MCKRMAELMTFLLNRLSILHCRVRDYLCIRKKEGIKIMSCGGEENAEEKN